MSDSENKKDITEQEIIKSLDESAKEDAKDSNVTLTKAKKKKEGFFKGIARECRQITWLNGKEIVGGTVAVAVVSIILCIIIGLIDYIIQSGLNLLFTIGS